MHWLWRFLVVLVVCCATNAAAKAEKRVALVIGNSNYQHAGQLPNPVRDADAVAALLKASGFQVVEHHNNIGVADMRRVLSDFSDITSDAEFAIVYYAGH